MTTPYLQKLKILIAEDDAPTVEALRLDLKDALPDIEIDVATTVAAAGRHLTHARNVGSAYDVAILDFKLPRNHEGEAATSDFAIRNEISEHSPETIIIQISSYESDSDIRHFEQRRKELAEDYASFIPKSADDWTLEVIKTMECAIHTRRLRGRLSALAGRVEGASLPRNSYARAVLGRGGDSGPLVSDAARGLAVAELCADASRHWQSLSPGFQDELKRIFGFAMIDGYPYLGVAAEGRASHLAENPARS
jgi:CheY-like chemotaxis protein